MPIMAPMRKRLIPLCAAGQAGPAAIRHEIGFAAHRLGDHRSADRFSQPRRCDLGGVVGESVTEHNTVANIGRLFAAAKQANLTVAVSPHYYYPTDKGWRFEGALEKLMHAIGMFDRASPYSMEGFENSGADFMPEYKKYIEDGKTIVTSPHKMYGPEANDLVLQLRKNHVNQIILTGMSTNLCTESHFRELLEQGFEIAVVKDVTAAAKLPEGDGYLAAITNFRYMANAVWTTEEAVAQMAGA